jgi:putative transposase
MVMPRPPRITEPGVVYHLLNRRVMRLALFDKDEDYAAFERVLAEGLDRPDAPKLLAWCLMPNHWHLVARAGEATDLSTWMQWLQVTHTHRWHAHTHTAGQGPLYQGRFKSFPVQADGHFLTVCRYVEANALRARLVKRAENWRWGSLWARDTAGRRPAQDATKNLADHLAPWPVDRPRNWKALVNRPMADDVLNTVRQSATRGIPLGNDRWKTRIAQRLGLTLTLRPRGRPRKHPENSS